MWHGEGEAMTRCTLLKVTHMENYRCDAGIRYCDGHQSVDPKDVGWGGVTWSHDHGRFLPEALADRQIKLYKSLIQCGGFYSDKHEDEALVMLEEMTK